MVISSTNVALVLPAQFFHWRKINEPLTGLHIRYYITI